MKNIFNTERFLRYLKLKYLLSNKKILRWEYLYSNLRQKNLISFRFFSRLHNFLDHAHFEF